MQTAPMSKVLLKAAERVRNKLALVRLRDMALLASAQVGEPARRLMGRSWREAETLDLKSVFVVALSASGSKSRMGDGRRSPIVGSAKGAQGCGRLDAIRGNFGGIVKATR